MKPTRLLASSNEKLVRKHPSPFELYLGPGRLCYERRISDDAQNQTCVGTLDEYIEAGYFGVSGATIKQRYEALLADLAKQT